MRIVKPMKWHVTWKDKNGETQLKEFGQDEEGQAKAWAYRRFGTLWQVGPVYQT